MSQHLDEHPRWCQGGQHHGIMPQHLALLGELRSGDRWIEVGLIERPGAVNPLVSIGAGEDEGGMAWNLVDLPPATAWSLHNLLHTAALAAVAPIVPGQHPWWCWKNSHRGVDVGHEGDAGDVIEGTGFVNVAMFIGHDGRREVGVCVGELVDVGDGAWLKLTPEQARELAHLVGLTAEMAIDQRRWSGQVTA